MLCARLGKNTPRPYKTSMKNTIIKNHIKMSEIQGVSNYLIFTLNVSNVRDNTFFYNDYLAFFNEISRGIFCNASEFYGIVRKTLYKCLGKPKAKFDCLKILKFDISRLKRSKLQICTNTLIALETLLDHSKFVKRLLCFQRTSELMF